MSALLVRRLTGRERGQLAARAAARRKSVNDLVLELIRAYLAGTALSAEGVQPEEELTLGEKLLRGIGGEEGGRTEDMGAAGNGAPAGQDGAQAADSGRGSGKVQTVGSENSSGQGELLRLADLRRRFPGSLLTSVSSVPTSAYRGAHKSRQTSASRGN